MGTIDKTMMDALSGLAKAVGVYELRGPEWFIVEHAVCAIFPCRILDEVSDSAPTLYNDPARALVPKHRAKSGTSVKQLLHFA